MNTTAKRNATPSRSPWALTRKVRRPLLVAVLGAASFACATLATEPTAEAGIGNKVRVQECDAANFERDLASNKVFVAWFYAEWCPTCRKQNAALQSLAGTRVPGGPLVCRYDYDATEALRKRLGAKRQSTLVRFHKKDEKSRSVGETDAGRLKTFLAGD